MRGLYNHIKNRKLFYWLRELKYDVIFLQDTYCREFFITSFNSSWSGKAVHAITDSVHSRDVCILVNAKSHIEILDSHPSPVGRILLYNVEVEGTITSLINIYASNSESERKSFFREIESFINSHALISKILIYLFIYLGCCVAFNTVQVISRRVVGRAEETSTYSSLGLCTVNCRPTASNY